MKIKTGFAKEAPSAAKVAPSSAPGTVPAARRKAARGCLSKWTFCDYVLLVLVVVGSGLLLFGTVVARVYGKDGLGRYHEAECRVLDVRQRDNQACQACKGGLNGDQKHGWWDWAFSEGSYGWGEDGKYRTREDVVEEEEHILDDMFSGMQEGLDDMDVNERNEPVVETTTAQPPAPRSRRGFGKGDLRRQQGRSSASFPCYEVIVEVNKAHRHDDEDDDSSEEEEGGRHRGGGHHGGHGGHHHGHHGGDKSSSGSSEVDSHEVREDEEEWMDGDITEWMGPGVPELEEPEGFGKPNTSEHVRGPPDGRSPHRRGPPDGSPPDGRSPPRGGPPDGSPPDGRSPPDGSPPDGGPPDGRSPPRGGPPDGRSPPRGGPPDGSPPDQGRPEGDEDQRSPPGRTDGGRGPPPGGDSHSAHQHRGGPHSSEVLEDSMIEEGPGGFEDGDRHGDGHGHRSHEEDSDDSDDDDDYPEERPNGEGMELFMKNMEMKFMQQQQESVFHATLYDSQYTIDNFPQCSYSVCNSDKKQNEEMVLKSVAQWQEMLQSGDTFQCFFNPHNKQQVVSWRPHAGGCLRLIGFVLTILLSTLAIVFVYRRIKQCKLSHAAHRNQYATQTSASTLTLTSSSTVTDTEEKSPKQLEAEASAPPAKLMWMPDDLPAYDNVFVVSEANVPVVPEANVPEKKTIVGDTWQQGPPKEVLTDVSEA